MPDRLRVLVADDHPLFREGVVQSLSSEPDIEVVAEAGSGAEAVRKTTELIPDLVVLDLGMPKGGGIEATRQIAASCPATAILILTVSEDPDDLLQALKAGARGYVLKGVPAHGLVHAVRAVTAGEVYVAPTLASSILHEMTRPTVDPFDQLTPREGEILELVARGHTNREIGEQLYLAEKTVKHYMTNVLQKLHVRSRLEAALLAQRRELGGEKG
jgi:two-component system, NarL family, nitrate/nitrite response regulator NarL